MADFAAVPGEPDIVTARRLIAALRHYRHLNRRQLQEVILPGDSYDIRRASRIGALILLCRDKGWVRKYGNAFLPTLEGLEQLELAEAFDIPEGAA